MFEDLFGDLKTLKNYFKEQGLKIGALIEDKSWISSQASLFMDNLCGKILSPYKILIGIKIPINDS